MDGTFIQTNSLYDSDEQDDRLIVWKAQQRIRALGEREMNVANSTSEELSARNRIHQRAWCRHFDPDRPRIPPWFRLTSEEKDRLEPVDRFLIERARQGVAAQNDDPNNLWLGNTTPDEMEAIDRMECRARDRRNQRVTRDPQTGKSRGNDLDRLDNVGLGLFGLFVLGGVAFLFAVAPARRSVVLWTHHLIGFDLTGHRDSAARPKTS